MKYYQDNFSQLPEKVQTFIKEKFSSFILEDIIREKYEKDKVGYKVKLERWKMAADLFFDQEGNVRDMKLHHF